MTPEEITAHDARKRYCPMLGHDVSFGYCRSPASQLPCRKVFDCWWRTFDVEGFIGGHFSKDDVASILAPRQDKLTSIVDLIEKAREANKPPK